MVSRDPITAKRMDNNRAALATAATPTDAIETQSARGSRQITNETAAQFGRLPPEKLRDNNPALRTAYAQMLVPKITVSNDQLITPVNAALENGVTSGIPRLEGMVPRFDREWCRAQDSNL